MARSRIKSEEEYNEILGVNKTLQESAPIPNTNKSTQEDNNPFDRVVSLSEIKQSLHQDEEKVEQEEKVEEIEEIEIKEEPILENEDVSQRAVEHAKEVENKKQIFDFEENSKKLYENLRGSHISTRRSPANSNKDKEDVKVNEIDIIDEVSALNTRTVENKIPNTSPLSQELDRFEYNEPVDNLDLTADFTAENKNFIEAINQKKKEIKMPAFTSEIQTPPAFQDINEEVIEEEPIVTPEDDIEQQLAQQLSALGEGEDISLLQEETIEPFIESQPMFQQEDIFPPFVPNETVEPLVEKATDDMISNVNLEDEIDFMAKNTKKTNLNDTLALALDPEHTTNFSKEDIAALKNNEMKMDLEKSKRRPIDTITTVVLIILIIVVIALIVKYILGK